MWDMHHTWARYKMLHLVVKPEANKPLGRPRLDGRLILK
jgi:hypothetical protein